MVTLHAPSRRHDRGGPAGNAAGELEWWQRWAARRDAFAAAHTRLVRVVAVVRAVLLWVSVVWLGVLLVAFPELRPGMRAWVGCLWIVLVWFALARLRTLTLRGYLRFFVVCVAWSVVIGVVTTVMSVPFGGVGADGPGVGIAAWTEEALKLVPLAVLAVAAPRRVSRFVVADWLVLGIAAGAAFLAVEEYLRRTAYTVSGGGIFGLAIRWAAEFGDGDGLPGAFVRFGPGLLPREGSSTSGTSPGHVVATATVTVCVGLAIALARRLGDLASSVASSSGVVRWVPALAGLLPLGALALAVYDHAGWNASAGAGDRWLDADTTTVPLALRLFWSLTGHGEGRTALLFLLVAAAVAVDAARYARAHRLALHGTQPAAGPTGEASVLRPPAPAAASNPVAAAVVAAWRQVVSDLRFVAAARVKQPGEPRLVAVARGRVAAQMCRTQRELLVELARGDRPARSYRIGGMVALAVLVVGAFVLGPLLAWQIGPSLEEPLGSWLAGQLESIGEWFAGLSFGQRVAVGIGIAALVALSGGSLGLALGVSGVATYLMSHGQGAGAFVRDPGGATRSYLATRSPAEMAWDVAETVLTFLPTNAAGAAGGRWVRAGVDEYAARGGTAWRAQWRARHSDVGAIDPTPFRRGTAETWTDPAVRRQWVADRYADPNVGNAGMRRPIYSSEDWAAYQARVAGDQEIRLITPAGERVWADGVRVDPDEVVALDAKFVEKPGGKSLYEGRAPDFVLNDFAAELRKYAQVIGDPRNPVGRLNVITSTPQARDFLTTWAAQKMQPWLPAGVKVEDVLTISVVP